MRPNFHPSWGFDVFIAVQGLRRIRFGGLIFVGVALLLGGCASGPSGPAYSEAKASIPPLNPEEGRIFVYRQSRFTGSAWNSPIILNGQSIGEAPSGTFLYADRPPGDYTMICVLGFSGYKNPEKTFSLAAGQTVYLRVVTDMTGVDLDSVPPSVAVTEIQSTQYSSPASYRGVVVGSLVSGKQTAIESAPGAQNVRHDKLIAGGAQPAESERPAGPAAVRANLAGAPPEANRASVVATPDEAERILERRSGVTPGGLYALDDQTAFNVLDSVYYDPSGNVLSLVGHFDSRYHGPKIPYLQHLAVLLQSPQPEFSLEWTPESERKMDAFFNNHVVEGMSQSAADSLMEKWGRIVDEQNHLTRSGQLLLAAAGLSPIEGGRAPGAAGMQLSVVPGDVTVRVMSVIPGSAAERAGLRAGDIIKTIRGRSPLTPAAIARRIRISGEGQAINLTYERPGGGPTPIRTQLTPTASTDRGIWSGADSYDLLKTLYNAAGDFKAAYVIDIAGMMERARPTATEEVTTELRGLLINALGLRGAVNADLQAVDNNAMTDLAAMQDIYRRIWRGMDETFHFPGTPVADAYEQGYARRGGDPSSGNADATAAFSRQMLPKVKELLNVIFERPEGLQIPPELVEEQFHLRPEMVPQYLGVPGDSLLAQVMFDSDYLCKRLMNRPDLKQRISAYQTGFEFEVKHPQFRHGTGMYRIWISVDKMDTPQSPDGTTLALRDLTMRFNIRDQDGGHRDLPNRPGSYEELLTTLWNDFEVEYPTLHELRETAKLAAAARWMLAHNPSAALPEGGRQHWQGPRQVPGLVFMELAPDSVQGAAKTHVTTIAEGGVSVAPPAGFQGEPFPSDTSVVDLRGSSFFSPPTSTHFYTATAPAQGTGTTGASSFSVGWIPPPTTDASGKAESAVVVSSAFGARVVKVNFANGGDQSGSAAVATGSNPGPTPSAGGPPAASGEIGKIEGATVGTSAFGAPAVKAKFAPAPPITPGNDTRAGDQLKSAAATAASSHPEDLTRNFDIGGARAAGTVDYGNMDPSTFSDRVKKDPQMIDALKTLSELQAKREQLNAKRDELTLARGNEKDGEKMAVLTAQLDKLNADYQDNLVALAKQKEVAAKIRRHIDDTVEGAPPEAAPPPATTPAPATEDPKQRSPR
jgi:hypothetical protein